MIRVGVVGAGDNTRKMHLPGFAALGGVTVAGVVNRRRESSEEVAAAFGIPTVYSHWEELVADPGIDAVSIGTWPYLHCPVTLAALECGKHVLTEARIAMDAPEARAMLAASRAKPHLVAQVVPSPFTLRVDATVRRLLREGFIGRLHTIEVRSTNGAFLNPHAPLQWRQDRDLSGNNILTLGIWYEVLLRWIGAAEAVVASGRVLTPERDDPLTGARKPVRIPEQLTVCARMPEEVHAVFHLSAIDPGLPRNEVILEGTRCSLRVAGDRLYAIGTGGEPIEEIPVPPGEAGGWRVEASFIGAIRGEEAVNLTSFEDGVRYMEFTDAVHRSLASRREEAVG